MSETASTFADKIDRAVQRVTPLAWRLRRRGRLWMRRAMRKPRSVAEAPNLLPLLIQVLASFSKADGVLLEEEIDSSLGFLRYDYPQAVYSELRMLFRQALYEQQDLSAMAQKLAASLSTDRKIMLGVQLYDLISQAGLKQEQVVAFYSFMSQLGMAAQAIDIVYQLNASEDADQQVYQRGASPLEAISFDGNGKADIVLKSLSGNDRLLAFRYHDLILLKNYSSQAGLGPWPATRARRILPDLSRATHPDRRFRSLLPGPRDLFQRQEECFSPADFRSGEQGFRRSGTRALAFTGKLARSDLRAQGSGQGPARRASQAQRRQTQGENRGRGVAR